MSIRLTCRACRTAFVTADEQQGQRLSCPKCGAEQQVPSRPAAAPVLTEAPLPRTKARAPEPATVFVQAVDRPRRRGLHAVLILAFVVIPLLAVGGILAWPMIQAWLHPIPPDPIEVVASRYLDALIKDDLETTHRLSTIDEPPAIRSFRAVKHAADRDRTLKGSFRPIDKLHVRINEKFEFNPDTGRYQSRNPLGAAAETLDALHEAKAEQKEIARKIEAGSPDDLFDAAEQLGSSFSKLAEGVLAPKNLIPTYKQLVNDSKPPLPDREKALALDYGTNQETWDRLLKRPFATLRADGPFILDRAEVVANVTDKLASSGDPPTRLHLKLVRFQLESINTGWKIVSARREGDPEPASEPDTPPVKESPGASRSEKPSADLSPASKADGSR